MSTHVCKIFENLYKQLPDEDDEAKKINGGSLLYETYCPKNGEVHGTCNSDIDRISAGFLYLLPQLFDNAEYEGEHEDQKDNYVYYSLMWASYKLQQSNKNNGKSIGLNEFFTGHIANSEWYDVVQEHIEPKKSLLNNDVNIEYMSDIYHIFKDMCKIFSNNDDQIDNIDFMSYYESVKRCGENIFKKIDCIKKIHPSNNALPEIPEIEEIKETLKSDFERLNSPDIMDEHIETQYDGSEISDGVSYCEQINFINDLEQQQNEETTEDPRNSIFLDEYTVPDYEFAIINYKPHDFFDGVEVSDIEVDEEIVLGEVEVPDINAGYLGPQDEIFYIDSDFSTFEDDLSHSVMEPKNMYFFHPDLDIEQNDLDNEQTDFDNQLQPYQTNTLTFDDPFKKPENFSDNIMCKVHGPKSVYCNRIILFSMEEDKKTKENKKMKRVINLLDRKKTKR
ncbi:Plasmodium variant antigen protein Cir/Yir/Bir, putative [Plasmodium chabaudi adami]|uniref:Plasmodium variant antigen protein Cir/Yir/Bir, putative n=1 Tax=Plasmodium chabaudi adami TaxID=5826 RepID=A0A1D3LAC6_PLACE|nr:Plasmodium variant antigen protein Cir/Yir/Bir, putative [Plasmodium chabaudi adami]